MGLLRYLTQPVACFPQQPIYTRRVMNTQLHYYWTIAVLVVGGYNYQDQWLADAEVYDPSTNYWTVIPPIHSHGVQHTATLYE